MSPQKKQTPDEIYATLDRRLELMKDEPLSRGDNIQLDAEDEAILDEIWGEVPKNDTRKSKIDVKPPKTNKK